MISKLAHSFLIFLLITSIVHAQTAARETSTASAEAKKAREERDKKAFALADQIIRESESLRLPENRIRINIALADSLWPRDEKRARLLFKQAVAALSEVTAAAADTNDREYLPQLPQQLRQEILQVAGNHDPALALEFLRATRPASPRPQPYWQPNYEAQLEMRLAMQVADKNPKEALAVAEDSLKLGLGQEATSLLYNLNSRDKAAGETFLNVILKQIRSGESSKSQAAPYIALTLLRNWIDSNRAAPDQAAGQPSGQSLAGLNVDTARELSGIIINAILNDGSAAGGNAGATVIDGDGGFDVYTYPGQLLGIIQQMKSMLPDVEKLSPARFPALSRKIAEFEKFNEAQRGPWVKYQQLSQTGTAEEMMRAATTAPPGVSDALLQQAAWKAVGQGDTDVAHRIIEKIADPEQRRQMEQNLARRAFERAQSESKLAEARALLSRFPPEERAVLLAQMATSVAAQDKPAALSLLSEAEALLGDRALNYQQLRAQLHLANAYEQIDLGRSAGLVQKAINQLNELAVAALVLNGFDLQQYFRDGELVINGGNGLHEMAQESAQRLASISRQDFDRAKAIAEEFQRPEMRLMALLQIAQAAFANDGR